jgi:hypothetical protein
MLVPGVGVRLGGMYGAVDVLRRRVQGVDFSGLSPMFLTLWRTPPGTMIAM